MRHEFFCELKSTESCCGIGEFAGWGCDDYGFEEDSREFDFSLLKDVISWLKSENKCCKKYYSTTFAYVPDKDRFDILMLKAMKRTGWQEVTTSKSKHGRYYIHVMMLKRRK